MTTLKIEGRLVGPWAMELNHAWEALAISLGGRKLQIDIREVSFIDEQGNAILREIFHATRGEILADTPLTQHFAGEICRDLSQETEMKNA